MKNSSFAKGLLVGTIISISLGIGVYITKETLESDMRDGSYLLTVMGDRRQLKRISYDTGYQNPRAILSPTREKVAYAIWEHIGYTFYVGDLDGDPTKMLSRQRVGEGNGGIDIDTFEWTADGANIQYIETSLTCRIESCRNPNDFTSVDHRYTINVDTREEIREELN